MAVTLGKSKLSVSLNTIVSSSIDLVNSVRRKEQAANEAEFQKAIADGLSYEDQVKIRQKQLEKERNSSFSDPLYISSLEKSVADAKKLNRFNSYRTKYTLALRELTSGKINEEAYLAKLKENLIGIDDPDLRLEIQQNITSAEGQVKVYHDTILSNQVKKAKYDGTQTVLSDAINRVSSARVEALLNKKEDEVTAYDETLSALKGQLSTVKVQDSINDYQARSSTRGVSPIDKLNYIDSQAVNSDSNSPIKIGDKNYTSAQAFWNNERDNYLAGKSDVFGNFFDELSKEVKNKIGVDTVKHGFPTQPVLDETVSIFTELKSRPELQPFLNKIDVTQTSVIAEAVGDLAKMINAVGNNNMTYKEADAALNSIQSKYGIDMTGYRLKLDDDARTELTKNINAGTMSTEEALKKAPNIEINLPKTNDNQPATKTGETPTTITQINQNPGEDYTVKTGESLSLIAQQNNTTVDAILEKNPELRKNPDMIKVGQQIKLPQNNQATVNQTPVIQNQSPEVTPPQKTSEVIPQKSSTVPAPVIANPSTQNTQITQEQKQNTPLSHTVLDGETVSGIAKKYGVGQDKITGFKSKDANLIYPGEVLTINK